MVIEPERILYYFESVALFLAETEPQNPYDEWSEAHMRNVRSLMVEFYKFCHIGTSRLHSCQTCGAAECCWEHGIPYFGAIGGGLTYEFTPTTIGMCVAVKYCGRELDLSDF